MEIEEDGIKGVVNLGLKKKLEKTTFYLDEIYPFLQCAGFGPSLDIALEPGFLQVDFSQEKDKFSDPDQLCPEK